MKSDKYMVNKPTVIDLIDSVRCRDGLKYIDHIVENIISIIDLFVKNDKGLHECVELLCLYNKPSILNEKIINHIKKLIDSLDIYEKYRNDIASIKRAIDISLYIGYELQGYDISDFRDFLRKISSLENVRKIEFKHFVHGLRYSFIKGITLYESCPQLSMLIKNTNTNEKVIFQLLTIVLNKKLSNRSNHELSKKIDHVFDLPKKDVMELARDLRRIDLFEGSKRIQYRSEIVVNVLIDKFKKIYNINVLDRDLTYARLLIFCYMKLLSPAFLTWLYEHVEKYKLSYEDYNNLCALNGYDCPTIATINCNLYISNELPKILSPSKYDNIQEYFKGMVGYWRRYLGEGSWQRKEYKTLVSVIMTTFNANIALFKVSLESLMLQTHKNIEIIIIDDCSNKNSKSAILEIINEFKYRYPYKIIYHCNKERCGQYKSRNIALKYAAGKFITIQDDDDLSHPYRISLQLNYMEGDSNILATQTSHLRFTKSSKIVLDGNTLGEIYGDSLVSSMWRSTIFDEIGNFVPLKSRGDVEFRQRIIRSIGKERVGYIDIPLVLMRGDYCTVSSQKEYYFRTAVKSIRKIIDNAGPLRDVSYRNLLVPYNLS